jgi:Zn-dependent peptidase ImmA (M78 family)
VSLSSKVQEYLDHLLTDECYDNHQLQLNVVLKKLGLLFAEAEFVDPAISGMIYAKNGVYTVYVNRRHSQTRKRFTAAHEVGHYISAQCDSLSKVQLSQEGFKDYVVSFRKDGICSEAETEANEIAAQMLMPEKWVKQFLDMNLNIEQMANNFFISESAMTVRVEKLVFNSGNYLL